MAITASQVTTSNTLEQFRQQFNNLQSDVRGLESGTISFSQITTTSSNTTTLNVREDGVIVFEGATDDANETTLTVVDPTADRTISLPNETGTVLLRSTTENSFITGQTSITSGDIASANDELLISDADASTFKRVTVDNLISSAGGLTAVSADSTPQLGGDLDVNGKTIMHTFNITASGTDHYVFADTGNVWFPSSENDPTLYLRRGEQYKFNNISGGHPIRIQSTSGSSGTAYNVGVTNNAGSGAVIFKVPMSAPATLYYQCTSHVNMNGIINIV